MSELIRRYQLLSRRDQIAVKGCGFFLLCAGVWGLLLNPAYEYYAASVQTVKSEEELIVWMDQNWSRFESVSQASGQDTTSGDSNLLQTVSQIAERQSIQINRIEPTSDERVRSTYTNIDFPSLLNLLKIMELEGLAIDSVSIDSLDAPGFVNASLVIASP